MKSQELKNFNNINNNNNNNPNPRFNNFYNVDALLNEEKYNIDRNKINHNAEIFGEELNMINTLWEDLGVTQTYRLIFDSISMDLEDSMKKDLFDFEINSLKKFNECLLVNKKIINFL
jgi:hypothetical protein